MIADYLSRKQKAAGRITTGRWNYGFNYCFDSGLQQSQPQPSSPQSHPSSQPHDSQPPAFSLSTQWQGAVVWLSLTACSFPSWEASALGEYIDMNVTAIKDSSPVTVNCFIRFSNYVCGGQDTTPLGEGRSTFLD
jgi:hypothetical protein